MTTRRNSRSIPLALTMLVALLSAVVALAVSGAHDASGHGTGEHAVASKAITPKKVAFHDDMRKLWENHIVWTRLAIISLVGETPDTDATVARLLQNQVDIGNAVKPFYGEAAGNALTQLLREHILIAADIIAAAKAGDSAQLANAQESWVANADEIAALLHSANPRFWPLEVMKAEMHTHLDLTTEEAVARLQGNWEADVAAYDEVHRHILHMADLLSNGLIKQFPARFR